ncbi:hypothetical protein [Promineifilum sp.]|uniref:hypothetical protein n=1 Tax=Promineifilum sp. TaxID=2664178 RepID=UPI0035B39538
MTWIGNLIRNYTERRAAGQSPGQLVENLIASGPAVAGKFARAADTPRNREAAAHIIGIERWSQRRLRTALGDVMVRDEYDGYRPSTDLSMTELAELFAQTREQTVALAQTAANLPDSVTAPHNDLGDLSVPGWLYYMDSHATRECMRLRG